MYLKQLDLQGFKTFADRTQVAFAPGITCVVGPNGSGKSNIADAILWVLGENNVRELRGATNQDVIFAGNDRRRPLGMAEVSLTIDNSERILPIDFSEVTVTRRVYRSGDVECFINRVPSRLRDVYELFLDTGVGRDAYSMIGQGEIDQILSVRAEDRRAIFEEAAGIKKYRVRKREAERRLENTQQNLVRIHDILTEIEAQLGPLKRQAAATERFRDLAGRLRKLEHAWYGGRLTRLKAERTRLHQIVTELQAERRRLDGELGGVRAQEDSLRAAIQTIDTRALELQETERAAVAAEAEFRAERVRADERLQEAQRRLARIERELQEIDERLAETSERTQTLQSELEDVRTGVQAARALIGTCEQAARAATEAQAAAQQGLERMRQELSQRTRRLAELEARLQGLRERRSAQRDQAALLESSLLELREEVARLEVERGSFVDAAEAARRRGEEGERQRATLRQQLQESEGQVKSARAALDSATRRLQGLQAQRDALAGLGERGEGAQEGARKLMAAARAGRLPGGWVLLADRVSVPAGQERVWEAGLGPFLHAVLCDDGAAALAGVELLRGSGGAVLLPGLPFPGGELPDPPLLAATGAVAVDARTRAWLAVLLGKMRAVPDLQSGWLGLADAAETAFVTPYGERIDATGAVILAEKESQGAGSLLSRRREIEGLEAGLPEAQAVVEAAAMELAAAEEASRSRRAELQACEQAGEALRLEVKANQREVERRGDDLSRTRQRLLRSERELAELAASAGRTEASVTSAEAEAAVLQSGQGSAEFVDEVALATAREAAQRLDAQRRQAEQALADARVALAQEDSRLQAHEASLRRAREAGAFHDRQKADRLREQRELIAAREQQVLAYEGREGEGANLAATAARARSEQEQLRGRRGELTHSLEALRGQSLSLESRLRELAERCHQAELEQAAAESESVASARAWLDAVASAHSLEVEDTDDQEETPFPAELTAEGLLATWEAEAARQVLAGYSDPEGEIARLRRQIRSLGPINPDAVEQYARTRERFEFLTTQRADLDESREKLLAAIQEIDAVSRETFMRAFQEIAAAFDTMFQSLFGGGVTELKLTDPQDVLETGIEIVVQPPGKRRQNLLLLSGGERALTASAMLFALLTVRPSPFCVLDEIDAPLDESNVRRFCEVLKTFSNRTQFIVVTHNRGTMEAANTLYGVTMEERGVSRVLSCSLDDPATRTGSSRDESSLARS